MLVLRTYYKEARRDVQSCKSPGKSFGALAWDGSSEKNCPDSRCSLKTDLPEFPGRMGVA